MPDNKKKEMKLNVNLLTMLYELNIDNYNRFLDFYNNLSRIKKDFLFYSQYICKKHNKNIINNIWLHKNKLKNNDEAALVNYIENSKNEFMYHNLADISNIEAIKSFYDNVKQCNLSRKDVLDRLKKLNELGIENIYYNKNEKFSDEYRCRNSYLREWTFTDGHREFITPLDACGKNYALKISNAKYVYNYHKDVTRLNKFIFNSFDFDINSLPSKEDLINPKLDKRVVESLNKKREAILNTYNFKKSTETVLKELKQIKQIIGSASLTEIDYKDLEVLYNLLNNLEGFEHDKDKLLDLMISKYESDGLLSQEEMRKELVRTRKIRILEEFEIC